MTADLFLPPSERGDNNDDYTNDVPYTKNSDDNCELDSSTIFGTHQEMNLRHDPLECWNILVAHTTLTSTTDDGGARQSSTPVVLVDTHCHAHLNREPQSCYLIKSNSNNATSDNNNNYNNRNNDTNKDESTPSNYNNENNVISLTCAVEQSDWKLCLEYVSQSSHRMAAIGIHPWYLTNLQENWLYELEQLVLQHPGCMIGEIGLCKMAKFIRTYKYGKQAALTLQRNVFVQQLKLAGTYQRPVSIHCVNQHRILLDIFKELNPVLFELPPAIGLHSFSGTAHHVQQLIQWENDLFQSRNKKKHTKKQQRIPTTVPTINASSNNNNILPELYEQPLLYFGFSHCINYSMCSSDKSRQQGRDAIRMVPRNRLLAESDVHNTDNVALGTASAIAYIAWALDEPIEQIANLTIQNGICFLQTLSKFSSTTTTTPTPAATIANTTTNTTPTRNELS